MRICLLFQRLQLLYRILLVISVISILFFWHYNILMLIWALYILTLTVHYIFHCIIFYFSFLKIITDILIWIYLQIFHLSATALIIILMMLLKIKINIAAVVWLCIYSIYIIFFNKIMLMLLFFRLNICFSSI